ncbi:MAG: trifunctional glycosyltransferase/class I SAM-dependent methyltransferase/polysaccharide deacetylase [Steroidobacteraceae bacterium]
MFKRDDGIRVKEFTLPSESPRVSVVVPAYDAEQYIGTALESLLKQTFRHWEAIVVNDGSRDRTADVVKTFAAADGRIRLIEQGNQGASSARNFGLLHARYEWLLFLDADDWLEPDHLERLFNALVDEPTAEVVCCAYQRVTPRGELLPMEWWPEVETNPYEAFAHECVLCIHCVLVRTALVREVGGFDTQLRTCEDWDLWLRIARMGKRFVPLREPLGRYRMRADSLSNDAQSLFTDALVVMARAWNADERVTAPDPRYAAGIQGRAAEANSHVACWIAGVEAGAGRDPMPILDRLPPDLDCSDSIDALAECVMQAFKVGAQITPNQIAAQWSRLEESAHTIFTQFATRSHRPELVRQLMTTLESKVLKNSDLTTPIKLSNMMGMQLDLRRFETLQSPAQVDSLHLELRAGPALLGHAVVPVWSLAHPDELAAFTVRQSGLKRIITQGGMLSRPAFWMQLLRHGARSVEPVYATLFDKRVSRKRRLFSIMRAAVGQAVVSTISRRLHAPSSVLPAADLQVIEEERTRANREHPRMRLAPAISADAEDTSADRKEYWEHIFAKADPWNYGSKYEQLKYERTLGLLGDEPVGTGLEIACAEGRFTSLLASRVRTLRAVDISATALERARYRCKEFDNITFGEFDLIADQIQGSVDLIVCSEVLYFVPVDELAEVAAKYCAALAPRGRLVMAHASCIGDDPERTGFDWGHDFGARTICETFCTTPGLALERSIVTELYRIDLFRKVAAADPHPLTITQTLSLDTELDLDVERYVVWGGAVQRRAEVAREVTNTLPVLCYHRISNEGSAELAPYRVSPEMFEQQLKLLRRHGWHAVTMEEFQAHMRYNAPLRGRPVLITFDDGYTDFADHAWPILLRNDFPAAEVFIVSDKVGQCADWDAKYGEPAPLMSWEQLARLKSEGVSFGSHLATHRPADALSSEELLREAARSKAVLEARLGAEVLAVATPFGLLDSRITHIYSSCGYRLAFSTEPRFADVRRNALGIPRIEVDGHWDLDAFARAVGILPPDLAEAVG